MSDGRISPTHPGVAWVPHPVRETDDRRQRRREDAKRKRKPAAEPADEPPSEEDAIDPATGEEEGPEETPVHVDILAAHFKSNALHETM